MVSNKVRRFAADTAVPVARTRSELQRLLALHGATQWGFFDDTASSRVAIMFTLQGRQVRLELSLRTPQVIRVAAKEKPPHGWYSWRELQREAWCKRRAEQEERQRWRALLLITRAKLEIISDKLSTVEREFLSDIVLPNGQTVLESFAPKLLQASSGA